MLYIFALCLKLTGTDKNMYIILILDIAILIMNITNDLTRLNKTNFLVDYLNLKF